jgi:hypothetical protein
MVCAAIETQRVPRPNFIMKLYRSFAILHLIHQAYSLLDADALSTKYYGNDAPWYNDRIPFFESSDKDLTDVYYYRWNIFRAHQRDLGANGFISTEFLDDVGWQNMPWSDLNDATGFHLLEGRWCRDRRFKEDYANFMYGDDADMRHFSESVASAVWQGYLVDGVAKDAVAKLDAMQRQYGTWITSYDASKGLYYVEPLLDATEYTISSIDASGGYDGFTGGDSFRPSINSFQYANARAIASLAALKGGMNSTVQEYEAKAEALKMRVQEALWNTTFEHFIDRYQVNNTNVTYWDFIRGRELVGMVPWTHDLPDDTAAYAQAWSHVLNNSQLLGEHGLRTVEPSYEYYMRQYRYDAPTGNRECQWNGPIWPFQTTQVLAGLSNFLDHYEQGAATGVIDSSDYVKLLKQYAQLHRNPETGILDLEEDYFPDTALPIVGLKRSHHYFHSGFNDLILSGLVGIRPSADDVLEVNPLADSTVLYFRADHILYHGHEIAVQWDVDGSRYGTTGLTIEVDGKVVASSPALGRLRVPLTRASPAPITRKIAKSIQLNATYPYPRGSVSVGNASKTEIYGSIDGRIWFFPETDIANGWSTPTGNGTEVWFQVDFGAETTISSVELAFFANLEQDFDVPEKYRVQVASENSSWVDVDGAKYADAVANGITEVQWDEVETSKARLVFTPKAGTKVRLVELKLF